MVLFVLAAIVLTMVGALTTTGEVTAVQAAAVLCYFGVALVALYLTPRAGLAIAGVSLAAHAFWDIRHYRRDTVVSRSMAVWCIALDVTVGALCVAMAILASNG